MAKTPKSEIEGSADIPLIKLPDHLTHPDPLGRMRSYAPGYGPGPDGEPVELPEGDKGVIGIGAVTSNPVHLPQRSE